MSEKYAIRFGLGAIKAVGLNAMQLVVDERKNNGKFIDIFDFAKRIDAKNINKKSIEALSKSGSFDSITKNRRQIFESFDIISSYSNQQQNEANSNQMSFFQELLDKDKTKPELKKFNEWPKKERLQKEFEAFGFFLNEHPLDDLLDDLKKRGIVFYDKIEKDELKDSMIIKMAGIVVDSKHRSGSKGRFAYITISDPFGIFETMIFDEALITKHRDLLENGSQIMMESLVRKDDGGTRISIRNIEELTDFINKTKASEKYFEDIKQLPPRKDFKKKVEEKKPDITNKIEVVKENIIENVEIKIIKREAVFAIKSLISNKIAPKEAQKSTKIIFCIKDKDGDKKIELPEKYLINNNDLSRIRAVEGVL